MSQWRFVDAGQIMATTTLKFLSLAYKLKYD